jgi:hypothetical protein
VGFGVGNIMDSDDLAVSANQHREPLGPLLIRALGGAVGKGDGSVGIRQ